MLLLSDRLMEDFGFTTLGDLVTVVPVAMDDPQVIDQRLHRLEQLGLENVAIARKWDDTWTALFGWARMCWPSPSQ
jgi:hypothetical protein